MYYVVVPELFSIQKSSLPIVAEFCPFFVQPDPKNKYVYYFVDNLITLHIIWKIDFL